MQDRIAAVSQAMGNAPSASVSTVGAGAGAGASTAMSSTTQKNTIFAHCMQFPEGESDKFFVGAEDFNLYQCNLHSGASAGPTQPSVNQNNRAGGGDKHMDKCFIGHNAAITAVSTHPGAS